MKLITLTIIVTALLLSACNPNPSETIDKQQFEAFLTLKRVPLNDEVRYQRMQKEFERRHALAYAISNTDILEQHLINAEVEEFRKQALISRYFEAYLNNAVTDEGVQNNYRENIAQYKSKKVHVAHILFRVNPKMDESERQAVLTTALDARGKLTLGEDFSTLAKAVSEDKVSAAKGGDLGWINEGAVAKAFSEKAFSLKAGEISEPFLTPFGFHLLTVLEEPQEVIKPLESVKGDIRYQLRNKSKKAEIERLLNSVNYNNN